jgi:predicted metalloprotease
VDWTPGGVSSDIEDRRDSSGGGGGGFGFGSGGGGGMGIIGFVVILVLSLVTGRNFLGGMMSGGASPNAGYSQTQSGDAGDGSSGDGGAPTAQQIAKHNGQNGSSADNTQGEDRDVQLISFVLDDAQKTWTQIFQSMGKPYKHAKLVIYRGSTYSGCGTAQAQTGPFYCPQDEKIYIDLGFWNELKKFGGSVGEFAQAYVITHELGHHIQNLLGIMGAETRLAQQDSGERNALSVDLELQADCFSGVWGHSTEARGIVHPDDVAEALKAAAAVGDDHLQQMSGRAVSPESFTHGSSAQREHWFNAGLNGGTVASCNTFDGKVSPASGSGDY